ncbi:hypothetical protein [Pontibacter ruber]|uniref:Uncharacterized protein n=1 Tax=Pontibacter ruber TaxID=1343895 RepID=A0ABW5CX51_9BACT|nr:hypothetical protein [Pontibacter ruber]
MKKLITLLLVGIMAFGAQVATADSHDGDKGKGKKKGRPSFVDEKHRAHAEWKREKEYEKARKKQNKDYDDDDRWEDRRRDDDDRWEDSRREDERRREDETREQRRERERWESREEQRRPSRNRSLGEILQEGVRNGEIGNRAPESYRKN